MEEKRITAESIKDVVSRMVKRNYLDGIDSVKMEKMLYRDLKVELSSTKTSLCSTDIQARVYVFYKDMWEEVAVWGQKVFSEPSKRAINNGTEGKSMVNYLMKNNYLPQMIVYGLHGEINKRMKLLAQVNASALQMYGTK